MAKLNILIALNYLTERAQDTLLRAGGVRFLLDSGAFTAWKKGKEIALDDYCKAVSSLRIKPWKYFTLDKIGDPVGTRKNFDELQCRGFDPIPIFTRGEAISELDHYFERSEVVGIGGLVGTPGNRGFVNGIMKHIGSRKCHWLGFTPHDFMSHYRPFSCDASSWIAPMRFGGKIPLYMGNGRWLKISKIDFIEKSKPEIMQAVRLYGEDPALLARKEGWTNASNNNKRSAGFRLLAKTWVRYSFDVEAKLGTKLFLAVCNDKDVEALVTAAAHWRSHPIYSVGSVTPESRNASIRS